MKKNDFFPDSIFCVFIWIGYFFGFWAYIIFCVAYGMGEQFQRQELKNWLKKNSTKMEVTT